MKTGTLDKVKFMGFKSALGVPRYVAMGLLEGLWYMTAMNAQEGDIGRFSNKEIAGWLEWPGDPDELIEALTESGFLDRSKKYRLLIHHWPEHCPNHIRNNFKRWKKAFAQDDPEETPKENAKEDQQEPPYDDPPNLTKPNLTKPNTFLVVSDKGESDEVKPKARSPSSVLDVWTRTAKAIPALVVPRTLGRSRQIKIRIRLGERGWFEDFKIACEKLPLPGDGWQPDLDWMIANDSNVSKILEGKYDWRANGQHATKPDPKPPTMTKDYPTLK